MPQQDKLRSEFALLDVKRGRKALAKRFQGNDAVECVPVVIRGFIIGAWGHDDGVSQEFEVAVAAVEIVPPAAAITEPTEGE